MQIHPVTWAQDLAARAELRGGGIDRSTIARRVSRGMWQQPLPGVYCRTTGALTAGQRCRAALLYAGPGAALSHQTAAWLHGFLAEPPDVHVVVAHGRRVRPAGFVVTHQSTRSIEPGIGDALPMVGVARAALDCALDARSLRFARGILARPVQKGLTTVADLAVESQDLPKHGSRWVRMALEELTIGARSSAEALFVRLLLTSDMPMPELNAWVETGSGRFCVDALWRAERVVVEVDGRPYHFTSEAWEADLRRQNALHAAEFVVVRLTADQLTRDPVSAMTELRAVLRVRRPHPRSSP